MYVIFCHFVIFSPAIEMQLVQHFSKTEIFHSDGVMGYITTFYCKFFWTSVVEKFENLSTFDRLTDNAVGVYFFGPPCTCLDFTLYQHVTNMGTISGVNHFKSTSLQVTNCPC